jgi:hypothetical protein
VWTWPFLLHLLAFASVASFLTFPSPDFFPHLCSSLGSVQLSSSSFLTLPRSAGSVLPSPSPRTILPATGLAARALRQLAATIAARGCLRLPSRALPPHPGPHPPLPAGRERGTGTREPGPTSMRASPRLCGATSALAGAAPQVHYPHVAILGGL